MNYLLNILIGFFVAQLIDIFRRNRNSENSPQKFNFLFFLKDNWQKILVSVLLSVSVGTFIELNGIDVKPFLDGLGINITDEMFYFILGFSPEIILQILKNTIGFLQPKEVELKNGVNETYERK